jgi:hypothetical protein
VRISRQDSQDYPTLMSPAGHPVPLPHWSSGVKRIIGLAYLLVWAWQEHAQASELLARPPARQMAVVDNLNQHTAVQLLLVTHSPLVMASVEPLFDPECDRWWDLDWTEANQQVELTQRPFNRYGDANNWLRSEAFDQADTGSLEREAILRRARQLMQRGAEASADDVAAMDSELQSVLGATDVFWNRWHFEASRHGWQP